jgi:glutamine synthetase
MCYLKTKQIINYIMSIIEYVWIGGNNELRSKTKVVDYKVTDGKDNLHNIPEWNYDGSSTEQAIGKHSEIILKPKASFKDPFRPDGNNLLVLCDTYDPLGEPLPSNTRYNANKIFQEKLNEEPWFGLEQEYFIIDSDLQIDKLPPQGQYYCSVGAQNAFNRHIAEQHLQYCLKAGIHIAGINAEVAPGQWEFQIGICEGIEAGDHLWMARYILERIGELHHLIIDFSPKPLKGDWNGSGCHTNYSTNAMRNENGFCIINEAILELGEKHKEHMEVYGSGNEQRMTGKHETAAYDKFSFGVGNRGASVRIGNLTVDEKQGYFEDRRPSSNCDPYLVTSIIFQTTCLTNNKNK